MWLRRASKQILWGFRRIVKKNVFFFRANKRFSRINSIRKNEKNLPFDVPFFSIHKKHRAPGGGCNSEKSLISNWILVEKDLEDVLYTSHLFKPVKERLDWIRGCNLGFSTPLQVRHHINVHILNPLPPTNKIELLASETIILGSLFNKTDLFLFISRVRISRL